MGTMGVLYGPRIFRDVSTDVLWSFSDGLGLMGALHVPRFFPPSATPLGACID